MSLWVLLSVICAAGGIGGLVNTALVEDGFHLPSMQDGILKPGFIGNILTGAAAAGASWGLYGPFSAASVLGPQPGGGPGDNFSMSLAALIGAFFVGMGGARWLTSEVEKKLEKATNVALTTAMANSPAVPMSAGQAQVMQTASPAARLRMAKQYSVEMSQPDKASAISVAPTESVNGR